MDITGNTILVTGGAHGLGRALALAFLARGNRVVIADADGAALAGMAAAHPGMATLALDLDTSAGVPGLRARLARDHPALNVVIHADNLALRESIAHGLLAEAEAMIETNLMAPLRLNAAVIPLLQARAGAAIVTVTSGLAFVPMVSMPTYSASKAALHSYTQSLRVQLRESGIQVIELVAPNLRRDGAAASNGHALPLDEYVADVLAHLQADPDCTEVCVDRVRHLRFAERDGVYDALFLRFNSRRMETS